MKQLKYILTFVLGMSILLSCKEEFDIELHNISIQLDYPEGYATQDSVKVSVGYYIGYTDSTGRAELTVPTGSYDVIASESRAIDVSYYNFNGSASISVESDTASNIELTVSESSQIIIKEVYVGGCPTDDGSDVFTKDVFISIYNNSDIEAVLDTNFCIGTTFALNSNATNHYLNADGSFTFETEDWMPAAYAIWHLQSELILAPGEELVFVVYQAIDHTGTYSNSLDLSLSEYYPLYDINDFDNSYYYAAPSEKIPTSQYLNAINYAISNAWTISNSSPALFIFSTEDMGPKEFATDASRTDYFGGSSTQVAKKLPRSWVKDAVDIFRQGYNESNNKRLTDDIDAGYVTFSNNKGYTVYRNVNKEATEAIETNSGLLVYDYAGGTAGIVDGSTDPSGIDAEASIANGARIVFSDTNNSSNDFHQRSSASIK